MTVSTDMPSLRDLWDQVRCGGYRYAVPTGLVGSCFDGFYRYAVPTGLGGGVLEYHDPKERISPVGTVYW